MQLSFEIPDDIFLGINESKESLKQIVKQKFVLELYAREKISTSQGAKLLNTDIYSFMKFLSKNGLSPIEDYDIQAELNSLEK